jgi:hypothetical protein
VARAVLTSDSGRPAVRSAQEVATHMAKQVDVGNKGGSSGGKVGSAYGSNPSGKPADNVQGQPATPKKP